MKKHRFFLFKSLLALAGCCWSVSARVHAGSATWNLNPSNGDWNLPVNWSPTTVPNGPADIATFGQSNLSSVFLSAATEVDRLVFDPGASAYTIHGELYVHAPSQRTGITNDSGITQNFVAPIGGLSGSGTFPRIAFTNRASAGNSTVFTINGGAASGINGGDISFQNDSTAANATLINNGSSDIGASSGSLTFDDNSSAGNATLIANGGVNGGNGGRISFSRFSTGGTARVQVFDDGSLSLGGSFLLSVTIGSLEGNGIVGGLVNTTLSVGSNNLSTTFSGVIGGEAAASFPPVGV